MVFTVISKSSTIAGRCPAGEGYGQTQMKEGRKAKFARIECEHFRCRDSIRSSPGAPYLSLSIGGLHLWQWGHFRVDTECWKKHRQTMLWPDRAMASLIGKVEELKRLSMIGRKTGNQNGSSVKRWPRMQMS